MQGQSMRGSKDQNVQGPKLSIMQTEKNKYINSPEMIPKKGCRLNELAHFYCLALLVGRGALNIKAAESVTQE